MVLGGVDNRVALVAMGEPFDRGKICKGEVTRGRVEDEAVEVVVWGFNWWWGWLLFVWP